MGRGRCLLPCLLGILWNATVLEKMHPTHDQDWWSPVNQIHVLHKKGLYLANVDPSFYLMDSSPPASSISSCPRLHSRYLRDGGPGRAFSDKLPAGIPPAAGALSFLPCSWNHFLVGPAILSSPEVSHHHVMCPSEYQVSPTLEPLALDFVLWGWAVWGRRRFHPSTRDGSNTNAEFIEVVKQSVDNMDSVFLINTAIPRETANCGEVSKTQQRFPRLSNFGP